MPRSRLIVTTYRKHSTGRTTVTVYRSDGSRTEVLRAGDYATLHPRRTHRHDRLTCRWILPDPRYLCTEFARKKETDRMGLEAK